jgi:c-di-GMP-binding flagellar brake protein YcgR
MQERREERRKFVRLNSRLPVVYKVVGEDQGFSSLTRNVGGGGIALFTEKRLAPGTVLEVEVAFANRPRPVRFTASVIWSGALILQEGDRRPRAYEAGVRFLDVAPADRDFILEYASKNPIAPSR